MKTLLGRLLFTAGLLLSTNSCGEGGGPTESMEANFHGDGYSVRVDQVTINTYKFTVVENSKHQNAVFTVYGLQDESEMGTFNTGSRMRLAHVYDSSTPGQSFEVTFNNDDSWFAIYQDDWDGFAWIYSTRVEIIRGQFR